MRKEFGERNNVNIRASWLRGIIKTGLKKKMLDDSHDHEYVRHFLRTFMVLAAKEAESSA